jgi:hypothetical protein
MKTIVLATLAMLTMGSAFAEQVDAGAGAASATASAPSSTTIQAESLKSSSNAHWLQNNPDWRGDGWCYSDVWGWREQECYVD